jgi:hypothetical protein
MFFLPMHSLHQPFPQHLFETSELLTFDQWQFSHHKQLFEFIHPLWTPKCAKFPPISMPMELSSEELTNHPN